MIFSFSNMNSGTVNMFSIFLKEMLSNVFVLLMHFHFTMDKICSILYAVLLNSFKQ